MKIVISNYVYNNLGATNQRENYVKNCKLERKENIDKRREAKNRNE